MSGSKKNYRASFEPVSPIDIVENAQRRSRTVEFDDADEKKYPSMMTRSRNSSSSSSASLKTPRTARFAEATSVHSPINKTETGRSPFADPPENGPKPSDVGFGYIGNNGTPVEQEATIRSNGPLSPPLKSALKTPGTPGRMLNPLSPTFREEQVLEKEEEKTEVRNAQDLVSTLVYYHLPQMLTMTIESQSSGTHGEDGAPGCQFLLFIDCALNDVYDILDLQCNKESASEERSPSMGQRHQPLGSNRRPSCFFRLFGLLSDHLLCLLPRRAQTS